MDKINKADFYQMLQTAIRNGWQRAYPEIFPAVAPDNSTPTPTVVLVDLPSQADSQLVLGNMPPTIQAGGGPGSHDALWHPSHRRQQSEARQQLSTAIANCAQAALLLAAGWVLSNRARAWREAMPDEGRESSRHYGIGRTVAEAGRVASRGRRG